MLSADQRATIAATVPALRAHGRQITERFYRDLLGAHPELFDYFNPANQRDGGQAASLAASVLAYASRIDDLSSLGPMVERIANKHVSLEVRPEHYPVVGRYLLGAIAGVLGEAATPAVLAAWEAAYGQLAAVMAGRESVLAATAATAPGGWAGFRPLRVVRKVAESDVMTSFHLEAPDGTALPDHAPGQYVSVRVRAVGFGHDQVRQYSLSAAPNGRSFRISVKREAGGLVSNHLHDAVREGDLLPVHAPLGDFHLRDDARPVLLLSGGSGITAVLPMLEVLAREPAGCRPVTFLHAARHRGHHAFGQEVRDLAARRPDVRVTVLYQEVGAGDVTGLHHDGEGVIGTALLRAHLLPGALVYSCGPAGFTVAVDGALDALGVAPERRFSEAFAPDRQFAAQSEAA